MYFRGGGHELSVSISLALKVIQYVVFVGSWVCEFFMMSSPFYQLCHRERCLLPRLVWGWFPQKTCFCVLGGPRNRVQWAVWEEGACSFTALFLHWVWWVGLLYSKIFWICNWIVNDKYSISRHIYPEDKEVIHRQSSTKELNQH